MDTFDEKAREIVRLILKPYEVGERNGDWNLAAFMMRDHPLIEKYDLKDLAWAMTKETSTKNDVVGLIEYVLLGALREADRAAREECAQKCDAKARELAEDAVLWTRDKMPNTANEARRMKECAEDCAAAIRATIKGEKP